MPRDDEPAVSTEIATYPKQRAFIEADEYEVALTGGIGSGKSRGGAIRLLLRSKPGRHYMIAGPSYTSIDRSTFPIFQEYAEQLGLWGRNAYNATKHTAKLENGATYFFCSCDDPESLRGPSVSDVWGDELQSSKEEAYMILKGRLREGGKRGRSQWTFTPGSPDHWTSQHFIKNCTIPKTVRVPTQFGPTSIPCLVNPRGDGVFFRASLKENTFIEPDFYESLLRDYAASPMRIRRELEGECVYMEGAEWQPEYFDDLWFDEWPVTTRGAIKVVSLDSSLGKEGKGADYAAYIKALWRLETIDGVQKEVVYLDADMRPRQDGSIICQTGLEIYKEFNPDFFVVEEEMGMNLLIAELHRMADEQGICIAPIPMGTDRINKLVRIRRLTPYISNRKFRFKRNSPGTKILMEQLMAFPMGEFDDGPDSLEYNVRVVELASKGLVSTRFATPVR
jgi:phage terminase large subunit-like protein